MREISNKNCQLGIHCNGEGKIQVHIIEADVLICIKCAAGEENQTLKKTREDIRSGEHRRYIHRARSTGHRC